MGRRLAAEDIRGLGKPKRTTAVGSRLTVPPSRIDKLVEIIDHCTAAKDAADEIGERFLSYLLAMAIQESRSAMRQTPSSRN